MNFVMSPWVYPSNQDIVMRHVDIKGLTKEGNILRGTAVIDGPLSRSMRSYQLSKLKRQRTRAVKQSLIKLYKLERLAGNV